MKHSLRLIFLLGALMPLLASGYSLAEFEFDSPEDASAFRDLLGELRCVVCQNETLAGSQADVAQIMRKEVYRLVREGKDQEQVKAHLVDRYTKHVLYDPPFDPTTYFIWIGPFMLVGLGAFLLVRTLLVKRRNPDRELSDVEQQRLQELLTKADSDRDNPA